MGVARRSERRRICSSASVIGGITTQDPDLDINKLSDDLGYGTFGWDREVRVEITEQMLGGLTNDLELSIGVLNVADSEGLTGIFIDNFEIL